MKKNIYALVLLFMGASVLGCGTVPLFKGRSTIAQDIASQAGFTKEYIKAGDFTLMTYQRFSSNTDRLSIYIEGDGRAWESKYMLSDDPTPSNPLALKLAVVDGAPNIAYIARPGQYPLSGIPDCDSKYWSNARFSPEVIDSFNQAIDRLKEKSQAKHIELVGFSGGAAIAVLVAARRVDVISLRTVGGNLDSKAWCAYHHVSALDASLDPIDDALQIAAVPQRHFVGSKDTVVPGFITRLFVRQEGDVSDDRITVVKGVTHSKGWQERWRELLSLPLI